MGYPKVDRLTTIAKLCSEYDESQRKLSRLGPDSSSPEWRKLYELEWRKLYDDVRAKHDEIDVLVDVAMGTIATSSDQSLEADSGSGTMAAIELAYFNAWFARRGGWR